MNNSFVEWTGGKEVGAFLALQAIERCFHDGHALFNHLAKVIGGSAW